MRDLCRRSCRVRAPHVLRGVVYGLPVRGGGRSSDRNYLLRLDKLSRPRLPQPPPLSGSSVVLSVPRFRTG